MTCETIRRVPEVSAELAEALGRAQAAHQVVETWEEFTTYPDPMGFLAHCGSFKNKRRVGYRREKFEPLRGEERVIL